MNLSNNAFSLRDYLAYLFPGILLLSAYFLIYNQHWEVLQKDKIIASIVFLIGGYFLGYVSNVFSTRTIAKVIDKFYGKPFGTTLSNPKQNKFNQEFSKLVSNKLKDYWGEELLSAGESNLFYLCWRDIQRSDHKGIEYQFRLVSLWNFCTSTLFPSLTLSVILICKYEYTLSLVAISVFILMAISRVSLRREFSRNVYRIWYVINK
jgi:hypothetical protein